MSVFDIFKQLEKNRKVSNLTGSVEYIICGLGNPGLKYENTRHNVGFMCLDDLARDIKTDVKKIKFKSLTGEAMINQKRCLLMKPTTFMNNSGEAVVEALNFYKLSTENLIVVYDDISLDVGKMRIRAKGSAGGHNGMKSIIYLTGSDDFPRIKIGIGAKPHPDYNLADWVLSQFKKDEGENLELSLKNGVKSAQLIVAGKINEAMNKYNS